MRIKSEAEEAPEVAMAPLIDCVFLLLIFFLVASTLKKAHREVQIELPDSSAAIKTKLEFDTLVIELTQDGDIYLDGDAMTTRLLRKKLREAAVEGPNRRIRIDADRRTAFQYIVNLFDLCQFEGLKNVGVRAKDEF